MLKVLTIKTMNKRGGTVKAMKEERDELSRQLSIMMRKFVISYGKIIDADLSGSQVYILEILAEEGAVKSSYLAERLSITLPAVTNLANKLVSKGYIERQIPENDRRVTLLAITPLGQEIHEAINQRYSSLTDAIWEGFSDEEISHLLIAYKRMVKNLEEHEQSKE
ncbi:MarR family transcriptional regulator [Brevibacillus nitrificans]|uniref:MarR family winged helix-turn-helix transcriptional regulator n=1 Tax=Brevibacillus nitrificans TaxID=651560 RepID=UPI00286530C1|nr:MarR family transcriptional regulator [Brevibacillus nitrificans]MDR7315127.1 DNA-binding MarR family transcriptional regulator [Brevibacillus nitrificans]